MSRARGLTLCVFAVVLVAVLVAGVVPAVSAVSVTVPYSATAVAEGDLDGLPATGAWGDALSVAIPLENGAASPYGSAILYAKHDGTNAYFRIDGQIDVPWTSASGNHFWLGMEVSAAGTSHHGGSGAWDGVFFGLWDGRDYAPQPAYPPSAVDTNGFSKPPAKDGTQNALGLMRYSGSSAPYAFTAEWKRALSTGDASDVALIADGTSSYNFYATTDSDGGGSSGGTIDHSKISNLNTMKFASVPSAAVHDVAVTDGSASPTSGPVGTAVTISATVQNQGTVSETFNVQARAGSILVGTQTVTSLAAGASKSLSFPWDTTGAAPGSYTVKVEAAAVAGETDLADNSFTDGTVSLTGGGLLRVTTNPAVAAKIYVDGVPRDEWGLTWTKTVAGQHIVSYGDVYGYGTPAPVTVMVTEGVTTTVQGNYAPEGSLRVITSPALPATIYINGDPADDWGVWRSAAPGTYTIHFGAVAGYDPPADQTVTVTAGALQTVTGTYVANPNALGPDPSTFGLLRVTTNPAVPAQVLLNGIPRDEWGLAWVKLAPGTYTVSFRGVYGSTAPPPTAVTVSAGATTTYDAPFVMHGSLRVTTNPPLPGTVSVTGQPRDDWGMWQSMPPGSYTVSFGPVAGYVTPAPQTVTVTVGVLTSVVGDYVATPVGTPQTTALTSVASARSLNGVSASVPASAILGPRLVPMEFAAADGRTSAVSKDSHP